MKNKGQTLLEVIIATGMISVALVAIMGIVIQSLVANAESKQRTQATFLAQDAIERILTVRNWNNALIKGGGFVSWDQNFYSGDGYYDYGTCCTGTPYTFTKFAGTDPIHDYGGMWEGMINHEYDGIIFKRYIEVKKRNGIEEERDVNIRVTWTSSKGIGEVFISTVIIKLP
jgi:hypothetical protein